MLFVRGLLTAWIVCIHAMFVLGQSSKLHDREESIEKGEQLIINLSKARQSLPSRWACMVNFSVESTPDAKAYIRISGKSYVAEDSSSGTKVREKTQADTQIDPYEGIGDFETKFLDWERGKERIKWDDGKWRTPKAGEATPHLDPFMVCVGNSTILDEGISQDWVELAFLGGNRSCLGSLETKKGTVSVWGNPKPKNGVSSAWFVLHDPQSGLPIEFKSKFYETWDPNKIDAPNKLIQHSTTTWQKKGNDLVLVPVEVNANWNNNDEALEGVFEFYWLFGEVDLPDAVFEDPRIATPMIPDFKMGSQANSEE